MGIVLHRFRGGPMDILRTVSREKHVMIHVKLMRFAFEKKHSIYRSLQGQNLWGASQKL